MVRGTPEEETSTSLCDAIRAAVAMADATGDTLVAALLMQAGAAAGCMLDEAPFD